ncbi:hypothetical protein [uncultured Propionivibrio sp.]|uniref:hypothetical protein n=1 Tax=uncultured Propionivibrio sp. TaxID=426737 RepID=UPI0029C09776|nr:hypothetical protein [uncultured Propionivibrio sp.]
MTTLSQYETPARRPGTRHRDRDPDWSKDLPREWRFMVIEPLCFETHREYEIDAFRTHGFDEEETPCFHHHRYIQSSLCSDDDEAFYATVIYGEEVRSWRLRDGRWLTWRVVHTDNDLDNHRGFYSFSEDRPR